MPQIWQCKCIASGLPARTVTAAVGCEALIVPPPVSPAPARAEETAPVLEAAATRREPIDCAWSALTRPTETGTLRECVERTPQKGSTLSARIWEWRQAREFGRPALRLRA